MNNIFEPVVTVAVAIIGVAILAVLVSKKSNTAGVLASAGGAFANALSAATAPVTGAAAVPNVNAGASGFGQGGMSLGSFALPQL